ncbi:RHAG [Branchiostoma lanceolatum]|uniref:RHAG protein n=1 Tax=Branchiostoma lanceolatum TaxID=7740 RepID=A0A8J9Z165_BRALA|nr:RHAG [Branchiostoma lanceolatum]
MVWRRGKLTAILLIFEVVFIVLFGILVVYDDEANASASKNSLTPAQGGADPDNNVVKAYYPLFQDVHVMMFIGFGFLMTFLKKYGFGSVGFNFLVAAFVLQWATLMSGFLHLHHGKIVVDITTSFGSVGFNFLVAAFVLQWATLMSGFLHLHHGKIVVDITTGPLMSGFLHLHHGKIVVDITTVATFVLQWATLMSGFLHLHHGKIVVDITTLLTSDFAAATVLISMGAVLGKVLEILMFLFLLTSDFAAATVLISMGAVLGKVSHIQLIIMAFVEIIFFSINEWVGLTFFKAVDVGGSMFVHTFGAYFGLALARVLYREDMVGHSKEGSSYHSDIFAMIGTVFLWLFWPSFNAALAPGDDQHRAIINTYFSLAACAVVTFAISSAVEKDGKVNMVHVQNATLAGGVAVGTSADMMVHPWGALLIGSLAAVLSVVGYSYITPFMADKLKIHDTCGVHNLHGMPGVLAGIIGAIVTAVAQPAQYGNSVYQIFPARAPIANSSDLATIQAAFPAIEAGNGRSAGLQAGFQMAALIVTLLIALVTGALTGLLLRLPIWDHPEKDSLYEDEDYWEIPEEESAEMNGSLEGIGHKKPDSRARTESDTNDQDTKV